MNIKELIPSNWIIKNNANSISIWYSANRGNHNRKSFTFPKEIEVNENFAEAIGLFLGDGDMHNKSKTHLTYCSRDLDIASFVMSFLRERLSLSTKDITIFVKYGKISPQIDNIAEKLNVDAYQIKTQYTDRHRYPAIHLQVNGVVFRLIFEKIVDHFIHSNFLHDNELRRGFLRGIFAAEGCVGINYQEFFINSISFTLASHEEEIVNILQKALSLEGISFKKAYRKSTIETIISNWQNYLKCWQIGLFDRCERKKQAFLSVAKKSQVYAVVDYADLKKLSEQFKQKELAEIIGSWQGNVSRILRGNILLSLEQIRILEQKGINFSIKSLRMGNLTDLYYSKEIRGLFEE